MDCHSKILCQIHRTPVTLIYPRGFCLKRSRIGFLYNIFEAACARMRVNRGTPSLHNLFNVVFRNLIGPRSSYYGSNRHSQPARGPGCRYSLIADLFQRRSGFITSLRSITIVICFVLYEITSPGSDATLRSPPAVRRLRQIKSSPVKGRFRMVYMVRRAERLIRTRAPRLLEAPREALLRALRRLRAQPPARRSLRCPRACVSGARSPA